MRKFILFLVSCGSLFSGLYMLYMQLFVSNRILGLLLIVSAMLIVIGASLLFGEFIKPMFQHENSE